MSVVLCIVFFENGTFVLTVVSIILINLGSYGVNSRIMLYLSCSI